jgi:hypothetical protein
VEFYILLQLRYSPMTTSQRIKRKVLVRRGNVRRCER